MGYVKQKAIELLNEESEVYWNIVKEVCSTEERDIKMKKIMRLCETYKEKRKKLI